MVVLMMFEYVDLVNSKIVYIQKYSKYTGFPETISLVHGYITKVLFSATTSQSVCYCYIQTVLAWLSALLLRALADVKK